MTFDFAPDYILAGTSANDDARVPATPQIAVSPLIPPAPCAPAHPSTAEVAELVRELFAEGSLSYQQLRSLGSVPELRPHLDAAIDATPPARRLLRRRP